MALPSAKAKGKFKGREGRVENLQGQDAIALSSLVTVVSHGRICELVN